MPSSVGKLDIGSCFSFVFFQCFGYQKVLIIGMCSQQDHTHMYKPTCREVKNPSKATDRFTRACPMYPEPTFDRYSIPTAILLSECSQLSKERGH